jgi:hypothetical protein
MNLSQLQGLHARLKRELAVAYSNLPWNGPWIDRLTRDLADTERQIASMRGSEAPAVEMALAEAR